MAPHRIAVAGALAGALAVTLCQQDAHALQVARVTRHGYIMVDEQAASNVYEGRVPVTNTQGTLNFVADVTAAIDAIGGPHADYVATMQSDYEQQAFAFYLGMINDTYGIGMVDPLRGTGETYDLNGRAGTLWPVTGFVFLNTMMLYTSPVWSAFGADAICTQEFGHRWGAFLRIPPYPAAAMHGADAGPEGGTDTDADAPDGAPDVADNDAAPTDAAVPDAAPMNPPLAADALLGRQRAHWSYFVSSAGSPMEGNAWEEISPGVFRTMEYTPRFSPLDLYVMGLIPPEQVPPFFVIAEPNVMGQRDRNNATINRESAPNDRYNQYPVTIRGRRVDYTIQDIIRANGPRRPAYQPRPDGGAGEGGAGDGGAGPSPDMRIAWVMLTTPERVNNRMALDFDRAVETCTAGYNNAAQNLSTLVSISPPLPDAGVEAGADARADGTADAAYNRPNLGATGGCSCATLAPRTQRGSAGPLGLLAAGVGIGLVRRRRRRPAGATLRS